MIKRFKTGLVLGAEAARGQSCIGVINVLRRVGIETDIVAECFTGSLIEVTYACNRLPVPESRICSSSNQGVLKLMDLSWRYGGLLHGEKVFNHYRRIMPVTDIRRCKCQFAVVVANLSTGRELWFTEGDLYLAIQVSCGISGLMVPVRRNGYWLVDNAVTNPVPVSLTRVMGADIMIAIDL